MRLRSTPILPTPHLLVLALLLLTAAVARAADVAVGDKPTLKFNAYPSGTTVDLAELHGKIVLVDFFAAWCDPWMNQFADRLTQINDKYAGRGFQLLGVSLDTKQ